ncbi:MAG: sigma-70 family RNA polymerase sigma factor [Candidatus Nitrohelix vancouverensis]|uniref:RNA polymerase sigma factor n=1 Tax=Candidatus Nitrohelix vancouverensis TaxID=2705534 RepID=A0A7T0C2C7_9BACT|nr:MAG: sigma-70 family RNA polymerase sigma factor [Candidatus Nitrohelix vancouverensis]
MPQLDSEHWVDRYGDMMYRYALVRVKNPDTAEEIVQTTLLAALQAQDNFAGKSTEKSWLFGIMKHKIMDHFRQSKRLQGFDLSAEDASDPIEYDASGHWKIFPKDWGLDPEKATENAQLAIALKTCMEGLPEKFRKIFILKELEQMNSSEICNEFDIKPTNLWVILHRARNQLKLCLEAKWFENRGDPL